MRFEYETFKKCKILIDNIQKNAKFFYENVPEYHVIAAGSLMGVAMHKGVSYPVGKVNLLTMYPLSYKDFLEAIEEELAEYVDEISSDKNQTLSNGISW